MKGRKAGHQHQKKTLGDTTPRPDQNGMGVQGAFASGGKVDCMATGGRAKRHLGTTSAALHGTAPMAVAANGQARRPKKDGGAVSLAGKDSMPVGKASTDARDD